jgi:hypothetical protein
MLVVVGEGMVVVMGGVEVSMVVAAVDMPV